MNWRCKKHDVDVAAGMYCVACADEMEWTRIGLDGVEKGFADGRREFRPTKNQYAEPTGHHMQAESAFASGVNDPLPDFKANQAQLDRIEAMLKVLLFHEGIPDIPADRITGIVQGTIQ